MKKLTIPPPTPDPMDRLHLDRGMYPPYRRVWKNGEDVTDLPISEWPERSQVVYANGWRPLVDLDGTFMD